MTAVDPEVDGRRMNCREFVELVTDHLEDALPASLRADFDHHLGVCEGCRVHLTQVRATIMLAGRLGDGRATEVALSEVARDALLDAFRRSTGER